MSFLSVSIELTKKSSALIGQALLSKVPRLTKVPRQLLEHSTLKLSIEMSDEVIEKARELCSER